MLGRQPRHHSVIEVCLIIASLLQAIRTVGTILIVYLSEFSLERRLINLHPDSLARTPICLMEPNFVLFTFPVALT